MAVSPNRRAEVGRSNGQKPILGQIFPMLATFFGETCGHVNMRCWYTQNCKYKYVYLYVNIYIYVYLYIFRKRHIPHERNIPRQLPKARNVEETLLETAVAASNAERELQDALQIPPVF